MGMGNRRRNDRKRLSFKDCEIIWMNLRGLPTKYNENGGVRTFNVVLEDEELIDKLIQDGWNVKARERQDGSLLHSLPVEARYNNIPPQIWMITSNGRTLLDEYTVRQLDYADIVKVDLIVNGRPWGDPGEEKIKAFCKSMYVTIEEDEFAKEYLYDDDDVPFDE